MDLDFFWVCKVYWVSGWFGYLWIFSSLICYCGFLFCSGFSGFGDFRRPVAVWALGFGWECIWRGRNLSGCGNEWMIGGEGGGCCSEVAVGEGTMSVLGLRLFDLGVREWEDHYFFNFFFS